MGIGTSIFLLAVGAILAFAVTDAISGVDLTVVGYILMAAGLIGLVVTMLIFNRAPREERVVRRERDVY